MRFETLGITAITNRDNPVLRSIKTTGKLETTLKRDFEKQFTDFVDNTIQIDYTPTWQLRSDEVFKIDSYTLPPYLQGKSTLSVKNLERIRKQDYLTPSILAFAVFAKDRNEGEIILFQHFSKGRVIESGKIILAGPDAFSSLDLYSESDSRLLRLAEGLNAVYFAQKEQLLFRTPSYVNRVLPLKDYLIVATKGDMRKVLRHPLIECGNPEDIVNEATPDVRKGFAILKESGTLDKIIIDDVKNEVSAIINRGVKNIGVSFSGDRIIVKNNIKDLRMLLSFLNHGIYRSPLTGEVFLANSMRKIE